MGKFDGIFFVSDLDGTLLGSNNKISDKNKATINYFKSEGGIFTVLTGRAKEGVMPFIDGIEPNAPMGFLNGGVLYDLQDDKNLHVEYVDDEVFEIIDYVHNKFPKVGIELITEGPIYCSRDNEYINLHRQIAFHPLVECDYKNFTHKIVKVLFAMSTEEMQAFTDDVGKIYNEEKFVFLKSYHCFMEILPKGASKGNLLLKLRDILGDRIQYTISVGDNDNDVTMIKEADFGFAVSNATPKAMAVAKYVTVSNDDDGVAKVIYEIENMIKNKDIILK